MNQLNNSEQERRKIRLVFMIIMAGLIVQYVFVGIIGYYRSEPWPAFVLPGFKTVYHDGSAVQLTSHEFYVIWQDDISEGTFIDSDLIFKDIPRSMRRGVILKKFNSLNKAGVSEGGTELWLKERLREIYPDKIPAELKVLKKHKNYTRGGNELLLTDEVIIANHSIYY